MRLKRLAVFPALLLALAGCARNQPGQPDPSNPTAVVVWHYYNGPQKTAFDEAVKEFNDTVGKEKGVIVDAYSQGGVNDLADKVLAAAEKRVGAEAMPDVFASYSDTAYVIDQMGLAADLTPYLSEEEAAGYVDSFLEEGRMGKENALKIFPTAKSTEIFMLSQRDWDLFQEGIQGDGAYSGITLESLSTYEGIIQAAQAYYTWTDSLTPDIAGDGRAFFGLDSFGNYMVTGYQQLGRSLFSVQDENVVFDDDKDTLRKLWDTYYVPSIQGWFAAKGRFRSDDAKTGDLIAFTASTTGCKYFPDTITLADGSQYQTSPVVLPAPYFQDGTPCVVQQGAGMVVAKSSPVKETAAMVFLKWFAQPERNTAFSFESGYLPVTKAAFEEDMVQEVLQSLSVDDKTLKAIQTGALEYRTQKMYAAKAFDGSKETRAVLDRSLDDFTKEKEAQLQKMLESGASRDDAIRQLTEEAVFEEWYASFTSQIKDILKNTAG